MSDAIPARLHQPAGLAAILVRAPVVPVATVEDANDAVPMARALAAGGIGAIEITLRAAEHRLQHTDGQSSGDPERPEEIEQYHGDRDTQRPTQSAWG